MSYRTGIIAAQDGKTINDRPLAYDSSYGHLLVDTREEVGHIGIYEGKCGSQVLTVTSPSFGILTTQEQIFKSIPHNLPFVPRVSMYMLVRDAPAVMANFIGWYAGGRLFYGGFPTNEAVFVRVTETHVLFVHQVSNYDSVPYNSQLQEVLVRAKYIINSNEAAGAPYEITLPFI